MQQPEAINNQTGSRNVSQDNSSAGSTGPATPLRNRRAERTVPAFRPIYPPPNLYFTGYENSNFLDFRTEFRQYMMLAGITGDTARQVEVLHGILRGPALLYFERCILPQYRDTQNLDVQTIPEIMDLLESEFVTEHDMLRMKQGFHNLKQNYNEHPRQYLGRLREQAYRAKINSEERIRTKFREGLLDEVKDHAMGTGVLQFDQLLKVCDGYWFVREKRRRELERKKQYKNADRELMTHSDNYTNLQHALARQRNRKIRAHPRMTRIANVMTDPIQTYPTRGDPARAQHGRDAILRRLRDSLLDQRRKIQRLIVRYRRNQALVQTLQQQSQRRRHQERRRH